MEIKQRMSKRFAWLLGIVVLVSIGLLVACGSNYNSSDGLVVVGSQGSALLQTFNLDLGTGHMGTVFNSTSSTIASTCVLPGLPSSIVLDPTGTYAYTIITASDLCKGSTTGIQAFKVNSDGTMAVVGPPVALTPENPQVCINGTLTQEPLPIPVVPVSLAIDSAGKILFVADRVTTDNASPANQVPGAISVLSIGSGASLTEVIDPVTNGPFTVPGSCIAAVNPVALAVTPTVFPGIGIGGTQNAVCSSPGNNPPTAEFLYMVDASNNNQVWEFAVDGSTGALGYPPGHTSFPVSSVASVPAGVAVDPCDRFVYVSNYQSNSVSAFSICNGLSTQPLSCPIIPVPDNSLEVVPGSPFSVSAGGANGPGPLLVDPFGKTLYVVDMDSNGISVFNIAPVSGSLTAANPAIVSTGLRPTSIAIRGDDSWLFVTNHDAATLSEYQVTSATGALSAVTSPITTDNYPWGIAVK
jgi:DNA-binding beta-propeller fold protein YncE